MNRLILLVFLILGYYSSECYSQETITYDIPYHTPSIEVEDLHTSYVNVKKFSVTGLPIPTEMPCNCPSNWSKAGYRYFWKFGDGSYSTQANPIHQYASGGDYPVSVSVTPIYTEDEDIDQIKDHNDNLDVGAPDPHYINNGVILLSDYNPNQYNKVIELKLSDVEIPTTGNFYNIVRGNSNPFLSLFNYVNTFYSRDARANNPMTLVTSKSTDESYYITFDSDALLLDIEGEFTTSQGATINISDITDIPIGHNIDVSDEFVLEGNTCEKEITLKRLNTSDYTYGQFRLVFENPPGSDCAFDNENIFVDFTVNPNLPPGYDVTDQQVSSHVNNMPISEDIAFRTVSSFDPNEKSVDKEVITSTTEELTYTIDFQNYGDGDASTVKIVEQIPEHLNINSINVETLFVGANTNFQEKWLNIPAGPNTVASNSNGSFEYVIYPADRTIEFSMSNITLEGLGPNPEDYCGVLTTQGQLKYTIDTDPTIFQDLNEAFGASADIYFDNNEPVKTNATSTQYIEASNPIPMDGPDDCNISYQMILENDCSSSTYDVVVLLQTEGTYDISFNNAPSFEVEVDCGQTYVLSNTYPMYQYEDNIIEIYNSVTNCSLELPFNPSFSYPCIPDTMSYSNTGSGGNVITRNRKIYHVNRDVMEYPGGIMFFPGYVSCSSSSGTKMKTGLYFTGFHTVPENAEIVSAYLKLRSAIAVSNPEDLIFQIEDNASPAAFTSNAYDLSSRPTLPLYRIWDTPTNLLANKWYNVWGLTDMVQELVNKPDWDEGTGRIVVTIDHLLRSGGNPALFHSYNTNPTYAPRLIVKYKVPLTCKQGGYEEKEIEVGLDMTSYPNPAQNFVQIEFNEAPVDGQVEVFNLQGQLIMHEIVSEGTTGQRFDVSNLSKGVYLVKATFGTESEYHKIVVE